MADSFLSFLFFFSLAMAGCLIARWLLPELRHYFVGCFGAGIAISVVFIFLLVLVPPLVLDPKIFLIQLLFLGAFYGAIANSIAQFIDWYRNKLSQQALIGCLIIMVYVATSAYIGQTIYQDSLRVSGEIEIST